ncbi:hypothetical protein [Streptomyces sp. ISL-94]|uniref:hypothetical protein n=1 Tax=Streptomyces sp. ISL-94 TaxID=2819190 RepID=UPI001BEA5A30|nr:hypothetical protein [Streptomyces sp. ISL-94]MBT2476747.1 hypothetical protein [Streptomyces sp. ISL-94]
MTDGRPVDRDPDERRRWLRWVLGVPLGITHVVNAATVYLILRYPPQADWDDQGYAGTAAMCLISIGLSVIGILITLIPPVRRTLGLWWFAPPLLLGVIAWVRIATLE